MANADRLQKSTKAYNSPEKIGLGNRITSFAFALLPAPISSLSFVADLSNRKIVTHPKTFAVKTGLWLASTAAAATFMYNNGELNPSSFLDYTGRLIDLAKQVGDMDLEGAIKDNDLSLTASAALSLTYAVANLIVPSATSKQKWAEYYREKEISLFKKADGFLGANGVTNNNPTPKISSKDAFEQAKKLIQQINKSHEKLSPIDRGKNKLNTLFQGLVVYGNDSSDNKVKHGVNKFIAKNWPETALAGDMPKCT